MRGLIISFLLALALVIATYALMLGASQKANRIIPSDPAKITRPDTTMASEQAGTNGDNILTRQAMEQVIDCYAGKPVFLDQQNSKPLYPDCERLLRIYQSKTTDPERVLFLLNEAQKSN